MVSREQEEKILKETNLLVRLFVKTGASDIELSKMTGISSSTIGRRLTNKERIIVIFGSQGVKIYEQVMKMRKNNLQKGKIIGGQTSSLNNAYFKDERGQFLGSIKLNLGVVFDSELMQKHFLFHIALTFRAKPALLASLFQMDEQELLNDLKHVSINEINSLLFLIEHDETDQAIAKKNIISYYRDLIEAIRNKDDVTKQAIIDIVSDKRVSEIKELFATKSKSIRELNDEELISLLKYQLKYALSKADIARTFGMDGNEYEERIELLIQSMPELKERYIILKNATNGRKSGGRK